MSKFNDSYVCPVFGNSGKCNQLDPLSVMEQFKDFYETKLNEIDTQGGGDCLELKLKIQRRWIDDLTEQTQMMARVVKELEDEATTRVRMLEDKLRQTSKSAYEDRPDNIDYEKSNDCTQSLEEQLKIQKEEYEALKQSMLDMRSALTEEVACKHDTISALKKDVQQLEERCMQADKQTAFKDDIIKELRKEIKQLKQQLKMSRTTSKNFDGSKTIFTTVKHCRSSEKPKYSTVIFINENAKTKEMKDEKDTPLKRVELSKSEHDLLNAALLKDEIPVKEKSKFTLTNLNRTFNKT